MHLSLFDDHHSHFFVPQRMLALNSILILFLCLFFGLLSSFSYSNSYLNLTLPYQHPDPETVVQHVQSRINASVSRRRQLLLPAPPIDGAAQCLTGNPIDDCWRCGLDPSADRQRLADCAIGFGHQAAGGKGGRFYVVSDSSDADPVNPSPGTLRHAVIQDEPLWIVFQSSMMIKLNHELMVSSYKTIDGRGANVHITGSGCITLLHVTNVIIHNVRIYDCVPTGDAAIRVSPTIVENRGGSDGDGISVLGSRNVWIDHCSLSNCADGLIDVTIGSTAVTISNNYFSHHDKVMLLGHSDDYSPDSGMQVTVSFNLFGEGLVQRMPRCRWGYVHVVNNDYTAWEMYAIGGSAAPTINSQGNRFTAPVDPNSKEVTKRVDTVEQQWSSWNWRTDGDIMVNGAFFVPSGDGLNPQYAKASSVEPKSAAIIDQLTMNAGVMDGQRASDRSISHGGGATPGNGGGYGGGDFYSSVNGGAAPNQSSLSLSMGLLMTTIVFCALLYTDHTWITVYSAQRQTNVDTQPMNSH